MNLFLERLYNMQQELDNQITIIHSIDPHDPINYFNRIIALQVEIGELANEVRFFKFWSTNQKMSDKALAEYVDCLHFFLSLVNLQDYRELDLSFPNDQELVDSNLVSLTEMFAILFKFVAGIFENPTRLGWAFMAFLDLGYALGFQWDDIVAEYEKKHEENKQRQVSGY